MGALYLEDAAAYGSINIDDGSIDIDIAGLGYGMRGRPSHEN